MFILCWKELVAIAGSLLIVLLALKFQCSSTYVMLSLSVPGFFVPFSMQHLKNWNMACILSCHISLLNWWSSHVFIRLAVVKLREYWVNAILCMVSFLPFGDCGPCKFHALPHLLALLYGTGYTVEAIHIQYDNDFLWFIQVMDYHWLW